MERIIVFAFHTLALPAMAFGAMLPVNRATLCGILSPDKAAGKARRAGEYEQEEGGVKVSHPACGYGIGQWLHQHDYDNEH